MRTFAINFKREEDLMSVESEVLANPPEHTLIQVYACVADLTLVNHMRKKLSETFPGYPIIGANSNAGILKGRSIDGAIIVCFALFNCTTVKTILIPQNHNMELAAKETSDALADTDLKAVITFGCGIEEQLYLDNDPYLKTLSEQLQGVPIAGGLAGAESGGQFYAQVFTDQGGTESGFASAALRGTELRIFKDFDIDWVPIGKKLTITRLKGKRVYLIDDKPVVDLYQKYLGIDSDLISADLINSFPLMRNKHGVDLTALVSSVHEDGSADFILQLHVGEQVSFGIRDFQQGEIGIQRVKQSLEMFGPEGIFFFSCASRRTVFGEFIDQNIEALSDSSSFYGMYTFGEFFTANSQDPLFFHQSLTVFALAETPYPDRLDQVSTNQFTQSTKTSGKYVQLKQLIHMIRRITMELEEKNQLLLRLAHSDGLTGLGNRRGFDEQLDHLVRVHARTRTPFAMILLDVDFFKLFNDFYGHVAGDDCLRSLGHVLRSSMKRAGDYAFRYGGEEFVCLLSPANLADATTVAEAIRNQVEALGIPHQNSPTFGCVTVSLGVLTVLQDQVPEATAIIQRCDTLLYEAKKDGRNRTVSGKF